MKRYKACIWLREKILSSLLAIQVLASPLCSIQLFLVQGSSNWSKITRLINFLLIKMNHAKCLASSKSAIVLHAHKRLDQRLFTLKSSNASSLILQVSKIAKENILIWWIVSWSSTYSRMPNQSSSFVHLLTANWTILEVW